MGGKQVAIIDGQIAASGRTWKEVVEKAQKKHPDTPLQEITVFAVPKSLYTIYHA